MHTTIQLHRGTTVQNDNYTGAEGELTVDTLKHTVRVHDGSTKGGTELANASILNSLLDASGKLKVVTSLDGKTGDLLTKDLLADIITQLNALKSVIESGAVPIGTVINWPVAAAPTSAFTWLECNGDTISSDTYPELVKLLTGNDTDTECTLPDMRGCFLRGYGSQTYTQANGTGVGDTATTYTSGELLTVQGDAMRKLYGTLPVGGVAGTDDGDAVNANLTGVFGYTSDRAAGFEAAPGKTSAQAYFDSSRMVPTDSEFRPINMAVRYLIRAL